MLTYKTVLVCFANKLSSVECSLNNYHFYPCFMGVLTHLCSAQPIITE